MERRELERQIVEKEWLMFQQVQDCSERARKAEKQKHRREISLWRNMPI